MILWYLIVYFLLQRNSIHTTTDLYWNKQYQKQLDEVAGLAKFVDNAGISKKDRYTYMELVLHGLAEFDIITKDIVDSKFNFKDMLAGMFDEDNGFDDLNDN